MKKRLNKNNSLASLDDVLKTYKSEYHGRKALHNYHHWFPVRQSVELAGIIADLMGDGHLQGEPKWRIDYTSKSRKELERFDNEIFKLFGVRGTVRKCSTNKYGTMNLGVNVKPLGRLLHCVKVPYGAKVLRPFSIPDWIVKNPIFFSRFLNRLISCEGCVDLKNKYIEIQMHKADYIFQDGVKFFRQIRDSLNSHFGIVATNPFPGGKSLRKDGITTQAVRLKIKRKEDLLTYYKFVGIEDPSKSERLKRILTP